MPLGSIVWVVQGENGMNERMNDIRGSVFVVEGVVFSL